MLTNLTKAMISFPLIVLLVAVFYLANGGTIHPDLPFLFMCGFFAIISTLMSLIFTLFQRTTTDLMEIIRNRDELEDEEIYATLENVEDLEVFLKDLESDILKGIAAKKETKNEDI